MEQVKITILCDKGHVADSLREIANAVEENEERTDSLRDRTRRRRVRLRTLTRETMEKTLASLSAADNSYITIYPDSGVDHAKVVGGKAVWTS